MSDLSVGERRKADPEGEHAGAAIRDHLLVLRRRWWLIAISVITVSAAAAVFSLKQAPLYQATSEVLISQQNLAATLTGTPAPNANQPADFYAQTEAGIARVPAVAQLALKTVGLGNRSATDFLNSSSVSVQPNTALLQFTVSDRSPRRAARLATAYGRAFVAYKRALDTASLEAARKEVAASIERLSATGTTSSLYAGLVEKEQQIRTLEALQTANAAVIREAAQAQKVQPRPIRNAAAGVAVGLLLGIVLVYLWEALDTRVRSAKEVGDRLGLPLLARIPTRKSGLGSSKKSELTMLAKPQSPEAEVYRLLRQNLELANIDAGARVIMVTSALPKEGKSTTVANLAVAFALAGRSVILADFDMRNPALARAFRIEETPGLTNVALGNVALEDALVTIPVAAATSPTSTTNGGSVHPAGTLLRVLPVGPLPPDPAEFLETPIVAKIIQQLRSASDLVLIDSAPLLSVVDPVSLSVKVDGLIIVTRQDGLRRPVLEELRRTVGTCPARALGFVLIGAAPVTGNEYGYGAGSRRPAGSKEMERTRT